MKVAFFSGCLEYSVCLANALCTFADVDYFYSLSYVKSKDLTILNILDQRIGRREINRYRTRDIRNITDIARIAREMNNYDVVHVQSGNVWLHIMRMCFDTPIVCTVHDPLQHEGLPGFTSFAQDMVQRLMLAQSSKVIVHGEKLKELMIDRFSRKSEDVYVVPHGEFSFYKKFSKCSELSRERKRKRILFFGAIRKNKGLDVLIRAEALISCKYNDFTIVIAGKFENEPENNLEYYLGLMSCRDRYEIINEYIPNSVVAELFHDSDLVVLPYKSGSQSGVLALAMGYGKAIVATDVGSIGEVLEHDKAGLLVPPNDHVKLADALLDLLNHGAKCKRFGEYAKQIADETLSWDRIGEKTLSVYEAAVRGG